MSKEEIVCSTLDNSSLCNSKETASGNLNATTDDKQLLKSTSNNVDEYVSKLSISADRLDQDENEYDVHVMTGSYGEITLDQEITKDGILGGSQDSQSSKDTVEEEKLSSQDTEEQGTITISTEKKRPNSLVLPKTSEHFSLHGENDAKCADIAGGGDEPWKHLNKSQQTSDSQATSVEMSPSLSSEEYAIYSPRHQRNSSDTSGLSDLHGTITVDGDMVSFVAEDLQEKIKMSSPVSRWTDSSSFPGSRSSTPSLYKQALQPHIPVLDAGALADLEVHARKVATCLDTVLENLSGTLQSISSLTVDYMETYESAVCKTCDAVDINIKTMYQLIAKCEELSNSMKPLYRISDDIKEIKRALDFFENAMEHKF